MGQEVYDINKKQSGNGDFKIVRLQSFAFSPTWFLKKTQQTKTVSYRHDLKTEEIRNRKIQRKRESVTKVNKRTL